MVLDLGRPMNDVRRARLVFAEPPVAVIVVVAVAAKVSWLRLRRFVRRGDFGRLVVMLALVTLKKLEFAALRRGVGRDLRILCVYGRVVAGTGS